MQQAVDKYDFLPAGDLTGCDTVAGLAKTERAPWGARSAET
jgi:hypothetical protein